MNSPDLVICGGSPDIAGRSYCDSPEISKSKNCFNASIELSLENGINASEVEVCNVHKTPIVNQCLGIILLKNSR
ncbi:hypothetical protein TSUD_302480 [Trifolium subterraneum]|uniref:Uncharacterized protein n=1 Tax=Trifolium subterraneum TaxID=3900 RepID=A0A2Z6NXA8_TRISU|nr:hypothetical protein TSUD_302480 [Trifolium subterraneum]